MSQRPPDRASVCLFAIRSEDDRYRPSVKAMKARHCHTWVLAMSYFSPVSGSLTLTAWEYDVIYVRTYLLVYRVLYLNAGDCEILTLWYIK